MDSRQRYKAFISYSHHDRKAAEWLHRALEAYRTPRGLASLAGGGSVGALKPIFRDRDELSAAADLSEAIQDALDRSDALIVLCSPQAASSRWVDKELAHFLERRGVEQIITVIAPSAPEQASLIEMLPPSLRAATPPGVEPLAVDLRRDADGRRLARLKIAARLLGVSLDQLVQRDARRRLQVMTAFSGLALAIAIGMGGMTVATLKSRQIAREQRDETEALVAYMLGDLRQQLEPVGRLDLLDGVSAKVLAYYAKAGNDRLDDKALAQRAKAQTLLGTIREQRGDLAGAQDAFAQAAATTHALVERDPTNGDRIFDEAQNVFWLAYMEWRRGELAQAERGFKHYAELAQRLVQLDPSRADWRVEVAYAQNNLGTLMFEQGRLDEALAAFRRALVVFEGERLKAPGDKVRLVDAANTRAWIADSLLALGRPKDAFVERDAAARLLEEGARANPSDKRLAAKNMAGQLALARLELDIGRAAQARARVAMGVKRLQEFSALDPTNQRWLEYLVTAKLDAVDLAIWSGSVSDAESAYSAARETLERFRAGKLSQGWRADFEGRLARQSVLLAQRRGDETMRRRLARELLADLKANAQPRDPMIDRPDLMGFAQLASGAPADAVATLSGRRKSLSPSGLDVLARAYLSIGRRAEAVEIVRDLDKQGYAHPSFLAFWRDSPVGGILSQGELK